MLIKYLASSLLFAASIAEGTDCEICDLKEELAKAKSELSQCETKLSSSSYLNQVCSRVGSILGPKQDPALKTTVHKLLKHLNLESVPLSPDGSSREKEITFKITNNDLVHLRRYILNDEGTDASVQGILIRSLIPHEPSSFLDLNLSTLLPSVGPSLSPHVRPGLVVSIIIGVVAVLGLVLYRGVAVWKVILFIVVMSVTMTWANMYMMAAAKKQATLARLGNVPMTCLLEKQGWASAGVDFVKGLFSKKVDPCEEYYAAAMVDPLWEVSILDAITETACQLVIRPCAAAGIILGNFYNNVIDPIPFAWKIPVALIATVLLLFLMLLCCGYEVSIPFVLKIAPPKKEVVHVSSPGEQLTSDSNIGRSLSGSRFSAIDDESGDGGLMRSRSQEPSSGSSDSIGFDGLRQRSLPYPSTCNMPSPGSAYLDQSVGSADGSLSCSPSNSTGGGFRYPLNMY